MVIISQAPLSVAQTTTTGGTFQSAVGGQLLLTAPGSARLEGKSFNVRASGYVTLAAGTYTAAVSAILYGAAPGFTAASGNALFTATANVVQSGTVAAAVPVQIDVVLEGDSVSGQLQGRGTGMVNNSLQAAAAIGHAPTSINFASEPPVTFAAGFTAASQASAAVLDQFILEA